MADHATSTLKICLLTLLSAGVAGGCIGSIGQREENGPTPSITGTGGGVVFPSGPSIPAPDTGFRRLTRTEYGNTLRDLLYGAPVAAKFLDPDVPCPRCVFDNAADSLEISEDLVLDRYDRAASDALDSALHAGSSSRAKLLSCPLASGGMACARTIVSSFARRAWRRRVDAPEVDDLMKAIDVAGSQGDGIEEGVKLAMRMALVSPNFLYRIEIDPANAQGLHAITPYELATRLSYFIWSSTPDEDLLDHADKGDLAHSDVFSSQLARMLDDGKADALVTNFAGQWFATQALADPNRISPEIYPWTEDLRQPMVSEAQLFSRAFLRGDRSIADMLDAGTTFVNERLAKHYGLAGVTGAAMREVPTGGTTGRIGLLTQGATLTVTSNRNRTNVPRRGKWVLTRLLCEPPGEPPPNVPPLVTDPKAAGLPAKATVRDFLAKHKTMGPACAGCHVAMDPIGFGLEHYTGVGAWRSSYSGGVAVDATGSLGGQSFDGAEDLSRLIKSDPRFLPCTARTAFTYAFGRQVDSAGDQAAIDQLGGELIRAGGRMREVVRLIAASQAFQKRGGGQP